MNKLTALLVLTGLAAGVAYANASLEESYYPTSQVRQNDFQDVTDEEIRAAFDAEPQIAFPLRIAWYNMGTDELVRLIEVTEHEVESSYQIPKTLIEGFGMSNRSYYGHPETSLSLPAIRLAAARAKCDILVLVGASYRPRYTMNALAVFNILILPVLFNPAFGLDAEYRAEMYVIDVRNEFLYGQITYEPDPISERFLTMMARDRLVQRAQIQLQADAAEYLSGALDALFLRYRQE